MSAPIAFESTRVKAQKKEERRQAREYILEKAKEEYERKEKKKELARQRGEDTWMLASVSERIDEGEQDSKKKKKKLKKEKKKKEKKKKRRRSSGSSSGDSDNGMEWVESAPKPGVPTASGETAVKGPQLERDSWMTAPPDFFPAVSRQELREKRDKELAREKEEQTNLLDRPGQHKLELNPYWKTSGTGLPGQEPEKSEAKTAGPSVAGDGGLSWLRKAYKRFQEQAKEEGKTMEEVAADRYGSLEKLEKMIADAEDAQQNKGRNRWRQKRSRSRENETIPRSKELQARPQERKQRSRSRERRSRSRERRSRSRGRRSRERSRERRSRSRDRRSRSRERRSRSRDRRPRSRDRRSRSRSRSRRSRSRGRRSRSREKRSRSRDRRSRSRGRKSRSRSKERSKETKPVSKFKSMFGKFKKPGEDDDNDNDKRATPSSSNSGWRKASFKKPGEEDVERKTSPDRDSRSTRRAAPSGAPAWKKEFAKPERSRSPSPQADSPSASSSSSESDSGEDEPPVQILSEQEMNALGAKIVKAEIMGNQALANELKAKLEAARKAKETGAVKPTGAKREKGRKAEGEKGEEGEEIVLTRTDRSGLARPLPAQKHQGQPQGRRKKEKVSTHDDSGKRARYFDDDDRYELKDLVEREKMSTAEDANLMFARLAGKSIEKTDDDHQIDDVFMSRANKKQSDAKTEERDRSMAILEHKKVSEAMEKCHRCLEKMAKHLIIAIGIKVYLCLPSHRSLTEGHCLIVPIQHTAAGTMLDEDVWHEIQVFRKGLTRMFEMRGEDVVFMETSMHLRRHPHMAVEVVPMPKETGDMAPIYFKKAIQEAGEEWAQNVKLVDLSKKDVRAAVPKGFPYFAVDFGLQGGYAHVIEDEKTFPKWFGREIVGGMLDADPSLWRKPHQENFEPQRQKVLQFAEWWKPYDWTKKLKSKDSSSDDSDADS